MPVRKEPFLATGQCRVCEQGSSPHFMSLLPGCSHSSQIYGLDPWASWVLTIWPPHRRRAQRDRSVLPASSPSSPTRCSRTASRCTEDMSPRALLSPPFFTGSLHPGCGRHVGHTPQTTGDLQRAAGHRCPGSHILNVEPVGASRRPGRSPFLPSEDPAGAVVSTAACSLPSRHSAYCPSTTTSACVSPARTTCACVSVLRLTPPPPLRRSSSVLFRPIHPVGISAAGQFAWLHRVTT